MRIVVTGAAGYIGKYLTHRLKSDGHYVIGIDRLPCAPGTQLDEEVTCDLLEHTRYEHHLAQADCICHLAAAKGDWGISEDEYYRDNLAATRSLLHAAERAGVTDWVFYSTVSVLGPSDTPLDEHAPPRPVNPYGASKAACEELYRKYMARVPNARITTIRPSVVFGPGNPSSTNIFRLIDAIYKNRFLMIGDGKEIKTTSYVENLIDAHMLLMNRLFTCEPGCAETYHYVDAPAESTSDLVNRIYSLLKKKRPRIRLPLSVTAPLALLADIAAAVTKIDLPITSARVKKFCTATNFSGELIRSVGFEQRISIDEAIQKTVAWYLSEHVPNQRDALRA